MSNYLITGGCGFIASNFINYVLRNEPESKVVNLDLMQYGSTASGIHLPDEYKGRYKFVKGQITSRDLIGFLLREYQIDVVIHFAAQSHVDGKSDPLDSTTSNVLGTQAMLEAVREYGKLKRFVFLSSFEVYGESGGDLGYTGPVPMKPANLYAATKASAEMFIQVYTKLYKLPVVVVRCSNVYGPRQFPNKVVPLFILQIMEGKSITIQGKGDAKRSFIYVDDVVRAILKVVEAGDSQKVYNIGSPEEITIRSLAESIAKHLNKEPKFVSTPDRPFNDRKYDVNFQPLHDLGWKQEVSMDDGLKKTIEWYQSIDPKTYWS